MFCIPKEDRKPQGADFYKREVHEPESRRECAVCLENLTPKTSCLLPCSHTFHIKCVEGLRAFGVAQTCPMCRAQLPLGPEKLFEEATRRFLVLKCMVEKMKLSFESLTKYQQIVLSTIIDLLRIVADQGHIGASRNLGMILEAKGDKVGAESAYRKAIKIDPGNIDAFNNLGIFVSLKGDQVEAEAMFRKAIEIDPRNAAVSNIYI